MMAPNNVASHVNYRTPRHLVRDARVVESRLSCTTTSCFCYAHLCAELLYPISLLCDLFAPISSSDGYLYTMSTVKTAAQLASEYQLCDKEYENEQLRGTVRSLTESRDSARNDCLQLANALEQVHAEISHLKGSGAEAAVEELTRRDERIAALESQVEEMGHELKVRCQCLFTSECALNRRTGSSEKGGTPKRGTPCLTAGSSRS